MDYFYLYFTNEFLAMLVKETNRYAARYVQVNKENFCMCLGSISRTHYNFVRYIFLLNILLAILEHRANIAPAVKGFKSIKIPYPFLLLSIDILICSVICASA